MNLKEQTVYILTKDCKVKGDTYDLFEIDDVTEVHNQIILSKDELIELLGVAFSEGGRYEYQPPTAKISKEQFINNILL